MWNDRTRACAGIETFRDRYRRLFEDWTFGATVSERVVAGEDAVHLEHGWRVDPKDSRRLEGDLLVTHTMREGLIGVKQFLQV